MVGLGKVRWTVAMEVTARLLSFCRSLVLSLSFSTGSLRVKEKGTAGKITNVVSTMEMLMLFYFGM